MEEYPIMHSIDYITYAMDEYDEFSERYYDIKKLEIDIPYYGWYGTIDKAHLQECITNKLDW